ncbi:MAG: M14 family metallocarboxypeptidase [Rhizobacter sp.]|nr:M14 family metallocarboxypeptidase [Bacteriovorax sp.]
MENTMIPWGQAEKENWFKEQKIKRSYQEEVVSKINKLKERFDISQYGALSIDSEKYPVYIMKTKNFDPSKKTVLITGGVHGYETSGVHGALLFMDKHAEKYTSEFNFICTPCISPWSYETINRWNNLAIDPNRSFRPESPAEECILFLNAFSKLNTDIFVHFDLHETTDTDNTVFRIALEKRDEKKKEYSEIPDGFYVVGSTHNIQKDFQKAVIESVRKVTHIAPADEKGNLIGTPIEDEGVVNYDMKKLFLCGGFSDAPYSTTTEVYPDSPKVTDEICNEAQVAAVIGGLDYLKKILRR